MLPTCGKTTEEEKWRRKVWARRQSAGAHGDGVSVGSSTGWVGWRTGCVWGRVGELEGEKRKRVLCLFHYVCVSVCPCVSAALWWYGPWD